jgi:hypothetical protein
MPGTRSFRVMAKVKIDVAATYRLVSILRVTQPWNWSRATRCSSVSTDSRSGRMLMLPGEQLP